MKVCEKCNMTFTDDYNFCTGCGSNLTVIPAVSQSPNTYPNTQTPNAWTSIQNAEWLKSWGWLLFLILGLLIEWYVSAFFGCAIAVVGFFGAVASGNEVKKAVATLLGAVAVIMMIAVIVLS